MNDTPITDKIIADADACPETRVVFLIKNLANKCKEFERASTVAAAGLKPGLLEATRQVVDEIATERQRQQDDEGWDTEHDDQHTEGTLAAAAGCYALLAADIKMSNPPEFWPWEKKWWHPKNPRRDLIRAAALIVAEIERLDRASK